jgi:GntR family transcriptional regulator
MRLWFARDSEVTLREQLVTQIILGILSGDPPPAHRLPSTRELARRFKLHPNTVSAAYRQLKREGWVDSRHGSGTYVHSERPTPLSPSLALDHAIASLFREARVTGVPLPFIHARLRQWLAMQPADHFLLIEPDLELRKIILHEIQQAITVPIEVCGLSAPEIKKAIPRALAVVMPSKAPNARRLLPTGTEMLTLHVRSVPESMAQHIPAPPDVLIGIASRWPRFLQLARTMLLASGVRSESLLIRDARKPAWRRGLVSTAGVVCDSATAAELPPGCRIFAFSMLSDDAIAQLRHHQQLMATL